MKSPLNVVGYLTLDQLRTMGVEKAAQCLDDRLFGVSRPPIADVLLQSVCKRIRQSDADRFHTGMTGSGAGAVNRSKSDAAKRTDDGAVDCLVPARHLRELGIERRGKRIYELADGTEVTFDVGGAEFEFMDDRVGATAIFGADDAEPILGVTALESVGIVDDPRSQQLTRLPSARLKTTRRR